MSKYYYQCYYAVCPGCSSLFHRDVARTSWHKEDLTRRAGQDYEEQYFAGGQCWVPCVGGAIFIYLPLAQVGHDATRSNVPVLGETKQPVFLEMAVNVEADLLPSEK